MYNYMNYELIFADIANIIGTNMVTTQYLKCLYGNEKYLKEN